MTIRNATLTLDLFWKTLKKYAIVLILYILNELLWLTTDEVQNNQIIYGKQYIIITTLIFYLWRIIWTFYKNGHNINYTLASRLLAYYSIYTYKLYLGQCV